MSKGSEPAWPAVFGQGYVGESFQIGSEGGLTKREYFAAMAMQGICGDGIPGNHHMPNQTVRDAVNYADALLTALEKKESL